MNAINYLDLAKESLSIESDYKLAKALNISTARISAVRNGRAVGFDEEVAIKIAEIIDIDPLVIIADMKLVKLAGPTEKRKFWEDVKAKAGASVAILAAVIFFNLLSISDTYAGKTAATAVNNNMYYAHYNCKRKVVMSGFCKVEMSHSAQVSPFTRLLVAIVGTSMRSPDTLPMSSTEVDRLAVIGRSNAAPPATMHFLLNIGSQNISGRKFPFMYLSIMESLEMKLTFSF